MAGARTPSQAVRAFNNAFQQALACLGMGVIRFPVYRPSTQIQTAVLNRGQFVVLKTALGFDLGLKVSIAYRVVRHPS